MFIGPYKYPHILHGKQENLYQNKVETGRLIACENIVIERLNSEPLLLLSPTVQKPKRDECAWRKMWDLAVPEHYFSLSLPQ